MGFIFMAYQVNFCETKEQLKHLAEVVTGKADGSPTGADIDTSTLAYAGLVRDTLPELLSKLGWYSVGEWSTDPLISNDNQYVLYNGIRYVPLSTPYQVDSTANPDPEVLVGSELKVITDVTNSDLTDAQNELLPPSSRIYPRDGVLQDGQVVDSGTTHLRVLVGGEPTIVAMSPIASGSVSALTETGSIIGTTSVNFQPASQEVRNSSSSDLSYLLQQADKFNVPLVLTGGEYSLTSSYSGKIEIIGKENPVINIATGVVVTCIDKLILQGVKIVYAGNNEDEVFQRGSDIDYVWVKDVQVSGSSNMFRFLDLNTSKSMYFGYVTSDNVPAAYSFDSGVISVANCERLITERVSINECGVGILTGANVYEQYHLYPKIENSTDHSIYMSSVTGKRLGYVKEPNIINAGRNGVKGYFNGVADPLTDDETFFIVDGGVIDSQFASVYGCANIMIVKNRPVIRSRTLGGVHFSGVEGSSGGVDVFESLFVDADIDCEGDGVRVFPPQKVGTVQISSESLVNARNRAFFSSGVEIEKIIYSADTVNVTDSTELAAIDAQGTIGELKIANADITYETGNNVVLTSADLVTLISSKIKGNTADSSKRGVRCLTGGEINSISSQVIAGNPYDTSGKLRFGTKLYASQLISPGTIASGSSFSMSIPVSGANFGMPSYAAIGSSLQGCTLTSESEVDSVNITIENNTGSSVTFSSNRALKIYVESAI